MDGSEKVIDINKPDLEGSPSNQYNKVHKIIDPLDKEYRTQWEGHDPNIKKSHELLEIPQIKIPLENKYKNKTQNLAEENKEKEKSYTRSSMYSPLLNTSLWSKSYSK